MTHAFRLLSVACLLTVAGCTQPPQETAVPVTETSRDFGDYILYFNALTTDQLTAEIAQRHGIVRSNSRAMLNISILRKEEGTAIGTPVAGSVSASANNLTGQLKNVALREIREEEAIYYIGETAIADGETLIYTIDVVPVEEDTTLSIRYRKQFFVD